MDRVLTHDIPLLLQKVTIWRMFDCIFFHLRLLSYSIWCFLLTSLTSLCLSLFFSFSRSRALYFILSDSLSLSLSISHTLYLSSLFSRISLYLSPGHQLSCETESATGTTTTTAATCVLRFQLSSVPATETTTAKTGNAFKRLLLVKIAVVR